jgi:hypothetical protein
MVSGMKRGFFGEVFLDVVLKFGRQTCFILLSFFLSHFVTSFFDGRFCRFF